MSTQCKTIQEKLDIISKLINSFYSLRITDFEGGFIESVSGYFINIAYNGAYTIYYGSEKIFSLGHKNWQDACTDSEEIAINGNYRFKIPPYEDESGYDSMKEVYVNSKLTEQKYNNILKTDQIFNYMLESDAFPTYETIELAKGVREILHSSKKFHCLAFYIRHGLVNWDRLEKTKELYVK